MRTDPPPSLLSDPHRLPARGNQIVRCLAVKCPSVQSCCGAREQGRLPGAGGAEKYLRQHRLCNNLAPELPLLGSGYTVDSILTPTLSLRLPGTLKLPCPPLTHRVVKNRALVPDHLGVNPGCVTLGGKLFNLSVPHFPHLRNGANNTHL